MPGVHERTRSRPGKMMRPAGNGMEPSPIVATPELELLLCCARASLEPGHVQRLRALLAEPLDWERLHELARQHGLLPLLYWHLNAAAADVVPPERLEPLRAAFVANAAQVLALSGELLEILRLFEEQEIAAVAYKGPLLAQQLYGNVALRPAGDLDLVLRRADFRRARELLLARGYRPRIELEPAGEELLMRARYHEIFDRLAHAPLTVELHWAFTNGDFAVQLNFEALTERLERTALLGQSLASFAREDLLLLLCIHGSKHRWKRLEWISGVAEVLRAPGEIDWPRVQRLARECRSRRMLLLGAFLAHTLLEAPLPAELVRRMEADRWVGRLTEQVRQRLAQDAGEPVSTGLLPHGVLFHLQLTDRLQDRLRFLGYFLSTPDPERWVVRPVGGRALPLHMLFRPFQLGRTFIWRRLRRWNSPK